MLCWQAENVQRQQSFLSWQNWVHIMRHRSNCLTGGWVWQRADARTVLQCGTEHGSIKWPPLSLNVVLSQIPDCKSDIQFDRRKLDDHMSPQTCVWPVTCGCFLSAATIGFPHRAMPSSIRKIAPESDGVKRHCSAFVSANIDVYFIHLDRKWHIYK